MLMYPERLEDQPLVREFLYFHAFCMQAEGALVRLCICAGLSEPALLTDAISSKIMYAGPYDPVRFLATNCVKFFNIIQPDLRVNF